MTGKNLLKLLATMASVTALAAANPASALTFTLVDTGGAAVGSQARAGFEAAAFFWSSALTDNVNITLDIGFQSLGSNILGSTGSASAVALTSDVYGALYADRSSLLDVAAVATLRPLSTVVGGDFAGLSQLGMKVNRGVPGSSGLYSDRNTRFDNDGSANNIALSVNTANMKALGFSVDANGDPLDAPDGDITFSSDFAFDFNPIDGISAGTSDFLGVAIHEIGHALGFVSGVDVYDYYTYNVIAGGPNKQGILDDYAVGSTLDLFRYAAPGRLDWSTDDADKYFSVTGGLTAFSGDANFATGTYNGDGDQASHWQAPTAAPYCTGFIGVMNPYFCDGTGGVVTATDLAAMDAIGWDVSVNLTRHPNGSISTAAIQRLYNAAVPEPATWMQMIAGFGLFGGVMRMLARKRTVAFA